MALQGQMMPVLDDLPWTASHEQSRSGPDFNAGAAEGMWLHCLAEDCDRPRTSPYAAPPRAADLAGCRPHLSR